MNDPYTERVAAVRLRFVANFDTRVGEIETAMPQHGGEVALETLTEAHRKAHGMCGIGASLGYVETGIAARSIERVLLGAVKAKRVLTDDEIVRVREGIALLRLIAATELPGQLH
jgi:hypothetical protein